MAAPRFSPLQRGEMAELREAGWSCGAIGRKFGCPASTVQSVCLTLGAVPPGGARVAPLTAQNAVRAWGEAISRRFTGDEDALILALRCEEVPYAEIAAKLPGRNRGSVRMRAIRLALHQAIEEAA